MPLESITREELFDKEPVRTDGIVRSKVSGPLESITREELFGRPSTTAPATAPPPSFTSKLFDLISKPFQKDEGDELPLPLHPEDYPPGLDIETGFPDGTVTERPSDILGIQMDVVGPLAQKMGIDVGPVDVETRFAVPSLDTKEWVKATPAKQSTMDSLKGIAKRIGVEVLAASELAMSLASSMILYIPSKLYGVMALPFGREVADIAEEEMAKLGYQPQTEEGREAAELVGKGFELFLTPARNIGEEVSRLDPRAGYLAEFGAELAEFVMTGGIVKGARARFKPNVKQVNRLMEAREKLESDSVKAKELAIDQIPDEALKSARLKVLEVEGAQAKLETERLKKLVDYKEPLKKALKETGEEVRKKKAEIVKPKVDEKAVQTLKEELKLTPEEYKSELKRITGQEDLKGLSGEVLSKVQDELGIGIKRVKPEKILKEEFKAKEVDTQTGLTTEALEGERSPFFQTKIETEGFKKIFEGRKIEDVELYTQHLLNQANRWYHGEDIAIEGVRNNLSKIAARADEFRKDFLNPNDFVQWKDVVSEAARWTRTLDRLKIERRGEGPKLYTGIPAKEIVAAGKKFIAYFDKATGAKKFRPTDAARLLNQEFKRNFIDRSGNIRLDLLDKLGDEGYKVVQKMYLTKGSNSLAANMLKQMQKEVFGGLTRTEKAVLDKVILAERMADIGKYKTAKEFKYPEGLTPTETAIYLELFPQLEKLPPERAQVIRDRARGYFEWMKQPLQDMLDAQIISKKEFDDLSAHNYRKIKLVDIFDKRYEAKLGKRKPRSIYDSGVEALARGRDTDIYEPSSEIMALEVFNRSYGRVLNNEANLSLLELAKSDPKNPFVRFKEGKQKIPSGWQRIFVYEDGIRKPLHISPDMAKEWIYNDPMIKYRFGQFLRFTSGSPVLRTFATGINWGFALANLPRDVMHTWFAARMFDGKKWKGVYSNQLPIFLPQIGMDLARTFTDAVTRGKRYQKYIEEGGGMEFLVHQGRIFARGRRLESPLDKIQNFMGYFGETSEIMTRLAIRERVIRRRAKEQGISMKEARKKKEITREATFAARDYMDFGQGGGITKAADNAMPYLNAATQGTRGLWRTAVDNPKLFAYKVAQMGAATTLLYAAMRENAPKTTEALQGSIAMQNNFCIPLGDDLGHFVDEKGQDRYIYFKIPIDPGQKFFKAFFEGAYDKYAGYEVDVERLTNNLLEQSPVGVSSLPPTLSGTLGYISNKNFWLNEDIWKKTKKPFDWPRSAEEFIPGKTPEVYKDIGELTGLSPERLGFAVEELTTRGTIWSYLMGKGYEKLFADVPKEKREQHIAMVLTELPILKRFIGVTNPYSKYAEKIDEAQEKADLEHWRQSRELDRLTDGHLFEDSVERKDIFKYIRTFPKKEVRDRLMDRFDFQDAIKKLPERSFWLRLQGLKNPAKADIYYGRWKAADEEERKQLTREAGIIGAAGGVLGVGFWDEFSRVRRENETE